LVGVFNLELARLYGYLYQHTDKHFIILHDLQGYDEISLTGPVKIFSTAGERLVEPSDLGMKAIREEELAGGATVEEAAKIFLKILEGQGTSAQNNVVAANAGMALFCAEPEQGLLLAIDRAKESLFSGKAFEAFKKLISVSKS
jgi:anthranilate phosphoribosyltransferase